ncbi:MAG: HPP family protein [Haloferacaceae archaeon]
MFDRVAARVAVLVRRVRRIERRESREFLRWIETTENLIHLSVLVFVPLLIALVTVISNAVTELSFLLFPPLASGTYTLFANPRGEYASARKFVLGLTLGSLCGWAALHTSLALFAVPREPYAVHPVGVGLALLLTGVATWGLSVEEPSAFSTALLILILKQASPLSYVLSVFLSSLLVSGAFLVWRERFYERRARYLYGTVTADDHVLVPMRGADATRTAMFGARLAATHDAGKVVLLGLTEVEPGAEVDAGSAGSDPERPAADVKWAEETWAPEAGESTGELAGELEDLAATIRTRTGVPCEVVVASGAPVQTTMETARDTNCDLIVTPYEEDRGGLSNFVRSVFRGPFDAVAFRSVREEPRWKDVLVTVTKPGDTAHAMLDFATRLAGRTGHVSVCTCISSEVERRRAEDRLAQLVETATGPIETRVSRSDVEKFIEANARNTELVMLGSSRDRSAASRFISPPTFERIQDVECDVAVVDRADID